eukprot:CAMPEP_0174231956 /NCGR_PEP_ID=MMETSP0417-20130205/2350_1 /TAXON_ID=242541 /ORGANISM="Mayorella sp, Strain BSH-02190019" /LENGTH=202 /DNA_ID=CAMNT_0015309927 /DNA_START=116 /DNA_END=724 /DNA_ORIENTATION=+
MSWYGRVLLHSPVLVKGASAGIIMGTADVIRQRIEKRPWEWQSTAVNALYGAFCVAPFAHYWFLLMERTLPVRMQATFRERLLRTLPKVTVDYCFVGSLMISGFFTTRGLYAGDTLPQIGERLRNNFPAVWKVGLFVWPAAQVINLCFVPLPFRVLFLNLIGLCWNTFLSLRVSHLQLQEWEDKTADPELDRLMLDEVVQKE